MFARIGQIYRTSTEKKKQKQISKIEGAEAPLRIGDDSEISKVRRSIISTAQKTLLGGNFDKQKKLITNTLGPHFPVPKNMLIPNGPCCKPLVPTLLQKGEEKEHLPFRHVRRWRR